MSLKSKSKRNSERVGLLSIITNVLLFFLKYWVGIATGSVALIADAWHTLSDSMSSIAVVIGLKLGGKPPDEEHPFGHERVELVSTVLIGILLAVIGLNFFRESIERLLDRQSVEYSLAAKIVTILSVVSKEALAQISFYVGKKDNSPSLRADGWHHRSDALSSVIILFGIFLGTKFWFVDGVLGLVVSFLILFTAWEIIKNAASEIMGKSPDDETLKTLKRLVTSSTDKDVQMHHIHMHYYGQHRELTFHIKLPGAMSLQEAHDIANDIEEKVRNELNIEATIHMEPL
ncbi:cation diffusion facilitator family transporter [Bacteroidota bacterium]